jgi:Recombination endonuclease VII
MADSNPVTSSDREEERKAAARARAKAWREANRDRQSAAQKAWYEANKDRLKQERKAYYKENKATIDVRAKVHRDTNKDARKAYRRAYHLANRETVRAKAKVYNDANKDKAKAYRDANRDKRNADSVKTHRMRKYGLSQAQFDEMVRECRGKCPCCHVPFSKLLGESPCVNHCHTSGRVRGILCRRCNFLVGHANDNPKILRACARYLTSLPPSSDACRQEVDS